jgi:hypothetical protein
MHKTEAQNMLHATLSLNDGIGRIDDIITNMPEGNEKKIWIQKLGGLIGYIANELQTPIV